MNTSKFSVPSDFQEKAKLCRRSKEAFVFQVKIETGNSKWWTVVNIAVFWEGRAMKACSNEPRLGLFSKYANFWELIEPSDKWQSVEEEIERFALALANGARCLFRDNIKVEFKSPHAIKIERLKKIDQKHFRIET